MEWWHWALLVVSLVIAFIFWFVAKQKASDDVPEIDDDQLFEQASKDSDADEQLRVLAEIYLKQGWPPLSKTDAEERKIRMRLKFDNMRMQRTIIEEWIKKLPKTTLSGEWNKDKMFKQFIIDEMPENAKLNEQGERVFDKRLEVGQVWKSIFNHVTAPYIVA